ncbi:hypothetical protein BJV77DRAFT_787659 [Russula vinacea]|nr:hypothetical protein BJV77DRAFT_787659 [Russula vinacea]
MFRFRTRENAQRKYVDLIKCASAKWPNWDPPRNFRPGDFGVVNKKTGALIVEGNIYTHPDIAQIAHQYHQIQAAEVDHYQINSFDVRGLDVNAAAGANIPNVQNIVFQSRWQFNNKRGAILLMHRPRMTHVPDEFFHASLHLPILKGKCVVSQAWSCPGFYIYLSNRSSEQVTVNLRADFTHPAAPGINTNPSVTFSWSAEGCSGVRQYAYRSDAVYTPLFCLRSIRRPWLRRDEMGLGKEAWYESSVPWGHLNDEGETEPEDND